jgi:L-cysteine S-thiosulfotransferase
MSRHLVLVSLMACSIASSAICETSPSDVAFVEGAVETSLTGVVGDPEAGAKIASTRSQGNCVACHVITAMPKAAFQGNIAPPLDGVADRYSEAQLRGLIVNAKMTVEGTMMPAFYKTEGFIRPGADYTGKAPEGALPPILSAQQVEDVLSYILTLKE